MGSCFMLLLIVLVVESIHVGVEYQTTTNLMQTSDSKNFGVIQSLASRKMGCRIEFNRTSAQITLTAPCQRCQSFNGRFYVFPRAPHQMTISFVFGPPSRLRIKDARVGHTTVGSTVFSNIVVEITDLCGNSLLAIQTRTINATSSLFPNLILSSKETNKNGLASFYLNHTAWDEDFLFRFHSASLQPCEIPILTKTMSLDAENDFVCGDGFWGSMCDRVCQCGGHGTCDRRSGSCSCHEGWVGLKCENCANGFGGESCGKIPSRNLMLLRQTTSWVEKVETTNTMSSIGVSPYYYELRSASFNTTAPVIVRIPSSSENPFPSPNNPRSRRLLQVTSHAVYGTLVVTETVDNVMFAYYSKGYVLPFTLSPFEQNSVVDLNSTVWKTITGVVTLGNKTFVYGSSVSSQWMILQYVYTTTSLKFQTNLSSTFFVRQCFSVACDKVQTCTQIFGTLSMFCILSRTDATVGLAFPTNLTSLNSGIIVMSQSIVSYGPITSDPSTSVIYVALTPSDASTSIYFLKQNIDLDVVAYYAYSSVDVKDTVSTLTLLSSTKQLIANVTRSNVSRIDIFSTLYIDSVIPTVIDSFGGTPVTVYGEGFAGHTSVECMFDGGTVGAIVLSSTTLICYAPPSLGASCGTEAVLIAVDRVAYTTSYYISRPATPIVVSFVTDRGLSYAPVKSPNITLYVSGIGFVNSVYLSCIIESPAFPKIVTTKSSGRVQYVSNKLIVCIHDSPSVPSVYPTTVSVTIDGFVQSNKLVYALVGEPNGISISPSDKNVFPVVCTTTAGLPRLQVNIVDVNGNYVGVFDNNTWIVVLRDVSVPFYIPSTTGDVWSTATTNGVAYIGMTLRQPRIASIKFQIFIYGTSWKYQFTVQVIVGAPARIVPSNDTLTLFNTWRIKTGQAEVLTPSPHMFITDVGGNIVNSREVLPTIMEMKYVMVISLNILDNGKHQSVTTRASPVDGAYTFSPPLTLGYYGQTYSFVFTVSDTRILQYKSRELFPEPCEANEYGVLNTFLCKPCPPAGICNGGTYVAPQDNYWRPSLDYVLFYSCSSPYSDNSCMNGTCVQGYKGVRCSVCDAGFGKNDLTCSPCPLRVFSVLQIIGFLFLAAIFLAILIGSTLASAGKPKDQLPILIKMMTSHLQMLGQLGDFANSFPPILQTFFANQKKLTSAATSNLAALDCATNLTFFDRFFILMVVPFLVCAGILLVLVILSLGRRFSAWSKRNQDDFSTKARGEKMVANEDVVKRRSEILNIKDGWEKKPVLRGKAKFRQIVRNYLSGRKEKVRKGDFISLAEYVRLRGYMTALDRSRTLKIFMLSLIIVLFFMYPTLIEGCANILSCENIDFGEYKSEVLNADRSIICNTEEHKSYQRYAFLFGAFYALGVPLITVSAIKIVAFVVNDMDVAKNMFFFMTAGFHSSCWYWECVILVRKAVMIGITVFVRQGTLQTYFAMWLMAVTVGLNSTFLPYSNQMLSKLETLSIATITVTLNLGLLFKYLGNSGGYYILTLALLIANGFIIFLFIVFILKAFGAKIRELTLDYPDVFMPFFRNHRFLATLIAIDLTNDVIIEDDDITDDYENEEHRDRIIQEKITQLQAERREKVLQHKKNRWVTNLIIGLGFDENKENVNFDEARKRKLAQRQLMRETRLRQRRASIEKRRSQANLDFETLTAELAELKHYLLEEQEALDKEYEQLQESTMVTDVGTKRLQELKIRRLELETLWAEIEHEGEDKDVTADSADASNLTAIPTNAALWDQDISDAERTKLWNNRNRRGKQPPAHPAQQQGGGAGNDGRIRLGSFSIFLVKDEAGGNGNDEDMVPQDAKQKSSITDQPSTQVPEENVEIVGGVSLIGKKLDKLTDTAKKYEVKEERAEDSHHLQRTEAVAHMKD
eukprot:PhF_6_TR26661/c0_g1_i1/m.38693